jgi:hypothetical protein
VRPAVTELCDRLGVIDRIDAAVGSIKTRDRRFTGGQVLVGMAAAHLCGQDFRDAHSSVCRSLRFSGRPSGYQLSYSSSGAGTGRAWLTSMNGMGPLLTGSEVCSSV